MKKFQYWKLKWTLKESKYQSPFTVGKTRIHLYVHRKETNRWTIVSLIYIRVETEQGLFIVQLLILKKKLQLILKTRVYR